MRKVIGEDGYVYQNGSSGAEETIYIKYQFDSNKEDFLKPIEELYSQGNANDYWWEHITNPEEIGVIEYTQKHDDIVIAKEDALAIGDAWIESGIVLEYTLFSDYN